MGSHHWTRNASALPSRAHSVTTRSPSRTASTVTAGESGDDERSGAEETPSASTFTKKIKLKKK